MSLATKIFLALALVIVAALGSAGAIIEVFVRGAYGGYLSEFQRQQMEWYAELAGQRYAQTGSWSDVQAWLDSATSSFGPMPMMEEHMGPSGGNRQNRFGRQPPTPPRFVLLDAATGAPLAKSGLEITASQQANAVPVVVGGSTVAQLANIALTEFLGPAERAVLSQVRLAVLVAALITALLAIVVSAVLVSNLLNPLRKIEAAAARIAQGDLSIRVPVTTSDELARLAGEFNTMAESLEQQERLRQRMVSDVAHELRTPLTIVQGNLQAMLDGVYPLTAAEIQTVYDETELLERLVRDLHELAQAEAGRLPLTMQRLDLTTVTQRVADVFRPLAERKGITISVMAPKESMIVDADPDRIGQILHNFTSNAVRHTPPGGSVTLVVTGSPKSVVVHVEDTGPGIDAKDVPHVFDRFYRGDPSRVRDSDGGIPGGTGLGLAIAKALAEAQGGRVGVASDPDKGADFWLELPLADAG